jgi:hypothetical protein
MHEQITANENPAWTRSCAKSVVLSAIFALAILVAEPPIARADARDEVVAGMFRCAVIGDARTWLDCYYGAAQPLRAALGIPPAPLGQVRLSQNPPPGSPATGLSERYQTTADALRCTSTVADHAWLDCYYAAAQPVRAILGLTPAPQARLASAVPGMQSLSAPEPAPQLATTSVSGAPLPVTHFPLTAQMVSYSFNRFGMFTVTLGNGQKWRQESGDTNFAHWDRPANHYFVQITRGALHSLNLRVAGGAVAYKVEQIS